MRMLDKVIAEINKDAEAEIMKQGTDMIYVSKIPFSSPTMNYMTYGGVPRGKVTEFFGGEGGGKTTSALDIVGNAQRLFQEEFEKEVEGIEQSIKALGDSKSNAKQKQNLTKKLDALLEKGPQSIVYADLENTLDVEWAKLLGVDTEKLYLLRPEEQSAEKVLDYIINLMQTGEVGLVVLDSIPCLVPGQIQGESLEKKNYGGVAKILTDFSNRVPPLINKYQITFIGINQVREDLNAMYGSAETTPGGRAWKHLCSLRVKFRKDKLLDENNREIPSSSENPAGNKVSAAIVKTKVCRPNRKKGYYTLNYTTGINEMADTIEMAIKYGFILQAGAWYRLVNLETGEILQDMNGNDCAFQGMSKLIKYLKEDEDAYADLYSEVDEALLKE